MTAAPTLSTHVLDLVSGKPAAGIAITLWRGDEPVFSGITNADGRCPDLREATVHAGAWRLTFDVADYFRARGLPLADPPFLDRVPIDFGMTDAGHYHVPLLVSPYGYSTYRGS